VPDQGVPATREELEAFLKTAEVVMKQEGASGRTDPWTIILEDGKNQRRGLFKYIDRRRPDPLLLPDSFKYEIAAYQLNKYLGLDIVPPVVEREIEGIPGSLQAFVEDSVRASERAAELGKPPNPEAFTTAMQDIRVFENLVLNTCGELKDTFVHKETWKVVRVDFSQSFEPDRRLLRGCDFSRISREFYGRLLAWQHKEVEALLSPYLNKSELSALSARRIIIVDRIKEMIRDKGEKAVLYD
jgi:hypothetical protein